MVRGGYAVSYKTGEPKYPGVYACRVRNNQAPTFLEDIFLVRFGVRWTHLSSTKEFKGEILGWIGPLQRRMMKDS
jgi:hypothetical protein